MTDTRIGNLVSTSPIDWRGAEDSASLNLRARGRVFTPVLLCGLLWIPFLSLADLLSRSPPQRGRPSSGEPRVNSPFPACASKRETKAGEHRDKQLPYPGGSQLRNPKATKEQKSDECGR